MIIKFKNGYSVIVTDTAGLSYKEIKDRAHQAMLIVKAKQEDTGVKDAAPIRVLVNNKEAVLVDTTMARSIKVGLLYLEYRDEWVVAWALNDANKADVYWGQGHYFFSEKEARQKFKSYKTKQEDAVNLTRRIETGTAFQGKKLKEALDEKNTKAIELQLMYLDRDLAADLSEKNAAYPSMYRKEVLDKIIEQYLDGTYGAAKILRKAGYIEKAAEIEDKVAKIKELWKMNEAEVKDFKPPLDDPTDYAQIESDYSIERLLREVRHGEDKYEDLPDVDRKKAVAQELQLVFDEIDELIAMGADALSKAGWTKEDARRAIDNRYIKGSKLSPGIISYLRKFQYSDEAKKLAAKVKELKQAWHLGA